ncbi:MAG TPA: hypothetical protein VHY31_18625 [Streptosporangiaceae bacterium]|nr:hypothetical protein [Streptosporangiaceae bacterium]
MSESGPVRSVPLGYVFTSRRETPQEYRQRTASAESPAESSTGSPAVAGPAQRVFRLTAGFAEHDERLGSSASVEVRREKAPSLEEAEKLIWPAIWEVTIGALGDGDWRPSLNWLDVIELLQP